MRCLLLGKNGQLGYSFSESLPNHFETISLGRSELDVLDLVRLREVIRNIKPELLINTTAYTAVDQAETEVDIATKVNALAPRIMAEEMENLGGCFIHFSTDYVFDGYSPQANRETDLPNPLNVYGASKLYGEYLIKQANSRFLIFRTSWVYSKNHDNFVTKVISWAQKNSKIKIVSDQIGNPTSARELAGLVTKVLLGAEGHLSNYLMSVRGIYHCAGKGAVSRYELAKEILKIASASSQETTKVLPVSSGEFPTKAKRPLNSSLSVNLFGETFGVEMPPWQESLRRDFGYPDLLETK